MATNRGTVKKTPLSAFRNARTKGIYAVTLDEGETLVGVTVTDGTFDIMLFSDAGKCARFNEREVRPMGRMSHGVRGMRLKEGQSVISLVAVDDPAKSILTATEHGYGKRTPISEYSTHGRGVQGIASIATSERNGHVVAAALVSPDDDILLLSTGGKLIRTRASQVPEYSRSAQGVRLIRLEGETLASVRRVPISSDEVEELHVEDDDGADVEALESEVALESDSDDAE